MEIGDTLHSSVFGSFNLGCHTCGAVGYHIDCDLTYVARETIEEIEWRKFQVSNLKKAFCDCPLHYIYLCKPDEDNLTIQLPVVSISKEL